MKASEAAAKPEEDEESDEFRTPAQGNILTSQKENPRFTKCNSYFSPELLLIL